MPVSSTERERILLAEKSGLFDEQLNPAYDTDGIDLLDIADNLKDLLRTNKLTLDKLLTLSTSKLADLLHIDVYVAKIICDSAKKISFLR